MVLQVIDKLFTVCKVEDYACVDLQAEYVFLSKTDEELSLVCETSDTPPNVLAREDGWRAFRIEGTLDFSLVGILASITTLLADAGIGIFAISTFNTDYILVKAENLNPALQVLAQNGYRVSVARNQAGAAGGYK